MGKNNNLILILIVAALGYYFFLYKPVENPLVPATQKKPLLPWLNPEPVPPEPKPKKPLRPWLEGQSSVGASSVGGRTSPDGTVEITCDLPQHLLVKNVGGRDGAGLCVWTSIQFSSVWQNERALFDLQKRMRSEPGGGYPEKVDVYMKRFAPEVQYIQHTGGDVEILKAAIKSGRCPAVTYDGRDARYSGRIAHMVSLIHIDDKWAAVLDNNWPSMEEIMWLPTNEFLDRWRGNGGGWMVLLLKASPPKPPKN